MKKILFAIFVICSLSFAFFIFYIPKVTDRNMILYQSLVTYKDVTYKEADGQALKLDILMPTRDVYEKAPIIYYVHDGDFTSGDKSWLTLDIGEEITKRLLDEGYCIISMNFRVLNDHTHFPTSIVDIKDAIRYINSVNGTYDIDPYNVGIWGSGSGAYMALTVGYSSSGTFIGDSSLTNYPSNVDYVIDLYGLSEMAA